MKLEQLIDIAMDNISKGISHFLKKGVLNLKIF